MGGSRRKLKRSRTKVKVGLPRKNPHVFKPAFNLPPKLRSMIAEAEQAPEWDHKGTVISNYKSFGFVSNPNIRGVSCRTHHLIESESLNIVPSPPPCAFDCDCDGDGEQDPLSDPFDDGSDLEEDDLKSAMGKKRRDGKSAPLEPLTALQRVHISRLVEKHGDNYQSMFMDRKLNSLQHSVATLVRLCKRYHENKNRNLMILPS